MPAWGVKGVGNTVVASCRTTRKQQLMALKGVYLSETYNMYNMLCRLKSVLVKEFIFAVNLKSNTNARRISAEQNAIDLAFEGRGGVFANLSGQALESLFFVLASRAPAVLESTLAHHLCWRKRAALTVSDSRFCVHLHIVFCSCNLQWQTTDGARNLRRKKRLLETSVARSGARGLLICFRLTLKSNASPM